MRRRKLVVSALIIRLSRFDLICVLPRVKAIQSLDFIHSYVFDQM